MTYQSAAHRSQKSRPPAASTQKSAAANATKAHLKKQLRAGRPKHRQIALHPLSILLLLAAGVCIICWTGRVIADNFNVTAVVPAKPLTKPATIRSLADGAVITQLPVTVSGFCPTDSYVKLYANNTFSGAALCLGSETYSIETSLFPGSNRLLVQAYNTTDEPGPVGQAITVQYNPKQPQATSTPSSRPLTGSSAISATSASSLQLLLTSDFHYQTFVTGDTFSWPMDLEGGTPPYTVYITWGDGQSSTIVFKASASHTIISFDTDSWIERHIAGERDAKRRRTGKPCRRYIHGAPARQALAMVGVAFFCNSLAYGGIFLARRTKRVRPNAARPQNKEANIASRPRCSKPIAQAGLCRLFVPMALANAVQIACDNLNRLIMQMLADFFFITFVNAEFGRGKRKLHANR